MACYTVIKIQHSERRVNHMRTIVTGNILKGIKRVGEVNLILVEDEKNNILECVSMHMCGWLSGVCVCVCVCVCVL